MACCPTNCGDLCEGSTSLLLPTQGLLPQELSQTEELQACQPLPVSSPLQPLPKLHCFWTASDVQILAIHRKALPSIMAAAMIEYISVLPSYFLLFTFCNQTPTSDSCRKEAVDDPVASLPLYGSPVLVVCLPASR